MYPNKKFLPDIQMNTANLMHFALFINPETRTWERLNNIIKISLFLSFDYLTFFQTKMTGRGPEFLFFSYEKYMEII